MAKARCRIIRDVKINGQHYRLHSQRMTWAVAEGKCRKLRAKGRRCRVVCKG